MNGQLTAEMDRAMRDLATVQEQRKGEQEGVAQALNKAVSVGLWSLSVPNK